MAVTRSFKELVQSRVARDPDFAAALLREGIDTARYEALRGRSFDIRRVSTLVAAGLIERHAGKLRVAAAGFPLLDAIVADLAA